MIGLGDIVQSACRNMQGAILHGVSNAVGRDGISTEGSICHDCV